MLGQEQLALVSWQALSLRVADVEKHLLGRARNDLQRPLSGDAFLNPLDRLRIGRAAGVAGAVIVIVGKNARCGACVLHARQPTVVVAQIFSHACRIGPRIERGDDPAPVGSFPDANLEWNPDGRAPRQLLCRESSDAAMRQHTGQRGWKAKAIRKHELMADDTKFAPKEVIAIEHVPDQRFGGGNICIAFINTRAAREPSARRDV